MRKKSLLVAALLGVLSGYCASASAAETPDGPFRKSCRQCSVNGKNKTLYCKCKTADQREVNTSLRLPCDRAINNCNGSLRCGPC